MNNTINHYNNLYTPGQELHESINNIDNYTNFKPHDNKKYESSTNNEPKNEIKKYKRRSGPNFMLDEQEDEKIKASKILNESSTNNETKNIENQFNPNFILEKEKEKDKEIEDRIIFNLSAMYLNYIYNDRKDLNSFISYLKNSCLDLLDSIKYKDISLMYFLKDDFNKVTDKKDMNTFKNLKLAYILLTFLNEKHSIVNEYEEALFSLLFNYVAGDNDNIHEKYKSEIPKKYFSKVDYLYNIISDDINNVNEEKIREYMQSFLNNENDYNEQNNEIKNEPKNEMKKYKRQFNNNRFNVNK